MISLYDYLGHAAGRELGAEVAAYAKIRRTVSSQRYVKNSKYKGMVFLYTKEFLDEFFKVQSVIGTNR